uniref:Uncharacterized protein n=1 Tax=Fagus sylvatica TaxID=28930 RepID=A0A2N9IEK5_FAGSY
MFGKRLNTQTSVKPNGRPVGGIEYSWCRYVTGGTGIAVLALLVSKALDIPCLQNAIYKLQNTHPILKSKLHSNTTTKTYSFIISPTPFVQIKSFNVPSTLSIIESLSSPNNHSISSFHLILEHELNQNTWSSSEDNNRASCNGITTNDMFFATIYALPDTKWVLVFRLHVSGCDRTTTASLMRELLMLLGEEDGGGLVNEMGKNKGEIGLKIEDLIPNKKAKKNVWARGVAMLRVANQEGIKLCGALVAAGLMAAYSSKRRPDNKGKKYGVVTLIDCRSILDPDSTTLPFSTPISSKEKSYGSWPKKPTWQFANSKDSYKHFSDMADLSYLSCKAVENPSLTTASSMRNAFMEDYMACASVHGVGPSIAIFDTLRDGKLDCVCVYPAPLHSREQMQELVDNMKAILVDATGANYVK